MPVDHEFGAQHTELKLSLVEEYLKAFTTALRPRFPKLWYIDAFAGTGTRTVRVEARAGDLFDEPAVARVEHRRGSVKIAIDVAPPFDRLIFIDWKLAHYRALLQLAAAHKDRNITVMRGNANQALQSIVSREQLGSTRMVIFLDPYGMDVEWSTLKAIAKTERADVWFLFSLSGLYRQATRNVMNITPEKRAAVTRILGTDEWEQELYTETAPDMFGATDRQRNTDVRGLEGYVKRRLETIFAKVLEPKALPENKKPQRFSLFLCISNRDPRAIGLATRIGSHIVNVGSSSKKRSL